MYAPPDRWDSSKSLRSAVVFVFAVCLLGAAGNWYNWFRGEGSLPLSIGLTVGALFLLMLTPRKWELLVMSSGGTLGLEILAVLLGKGPLRPLLEAMVITVGAVIICEYVKIRVEDPRLGRRNHQRRTKAG